MLPARGYQTAHIHPDAWLSGVYYAQVPAAAETKGHDGWIAFAETAAIIEQVDLVISIDTAVAHLAGALGRPVWTLLPLVPDWRWQTGRKDSPWYPSMRLFRQTGPGRWKDVIERVRSALEKFAADR